MTEKLRKPTRKSMYIQEEAVSALWDFAQAIGSPITGADYSADGLNMLLHRDRLNAIRPALERIMSACGYKLASIE